MSRERSASATSIEVVPNDKAVEPITTRRGILSRLGYESKRCRRSVAPCRLQRSTREIWVPIYLTRYPKAPVKTTVGISDALLREVRKLAGGKALLCGPWWSAGSIASLPSRSAPPRSSSVGQALKERDGRYSCARRHGSSCAIWSIRIAARERHRHQHPRLRSSRRFTIS